MTILELKLEIEGIVATIENYTSDFYIISYANQLKKELEQENIEQLLILCKKIIEWYEHELLAIEQNQFVYNKSAHKKTLRLLVNFVNSFDPKKHK